MPFNSMVKSKYPRRQWSLVGYPGDGKTVFSTQLQTPLLAIDADHRYEEVFGLVDGPVNKFDNPADNVLVNRIHQQLLENMQDEKIGTIVVDSQTVIIAPLVSRAIVDNNAGANENFVAAFTAKAVAMRLLQDAVTMWGTDVLWIYHLQDGRDHKAKKVVTATIPPTELARLQRSLNARLRVVRDKAKRGIKVEWCRNGRSGTILWDTSGHWAEMPEKLEQAMYDGLSPAEIAAQQLPASFIGPKAAVAWGVKYGAYETETATREAYDLAKSEGKPTTPQEMWDLWIVCCVAAKTQLEAPAVEVGGEEY